MELLVAPVEHITFDIEVENVVFDWKFDIFDIDFPLRLFYKWKSKSS